PLGGATRPKLGCFRFREATFSVPPERMWETDGRRVLLDVGSASDRSAGLEGFHAREALQALGIDVRWTSGDSSVLFSPVAGFSPTRLVVRARTPSANSVDVDVTIGGIPSGVLHVPPGDFTEVVLALPEEAGALFAGTAPLRIGFRSAVYVPKDAGTGDDTRPLGIAVDRISLE
ncbi:MAG TPA: hypothetical protein VLH41_04465, partial [Thermoanaerobaculia bacterium]|nr:hypothetical protein [Thermoanaerobaculia bacterium]